MVQRLRAGAERRLRGQKERFFEERASDRVPEQTFFGLRLRRERPVGPLLEQTQPEPGVQVRRHERQSLGRAREHRQGAQPPRGATLGEFGHRAGPARSVGAVRRRRTRVLPGNRGGNEEHAVGRLLQERNTRNLPPALERLAANDRQTRSGHPAAGNGEVLSYARSVQVPFLPALRSQTKT